MEAERRDVVVRVLLTPSEYVAMNSLAQSLGLSHSSMFRMWLLGSLSEHVKRVTAEAEGQ